MGTDVLRDGYLELIQSDPEAARTANELIALQAHAFETPTPEAPKLATYRASTLFGAEFERPPFVVKNFLPAGLAVLAGAPKRGKSWLSLLLGLKVASGGDFLGMATTQGDVLYLDLESRQYRVADRLAKLWTGPAPSSIEIAHEASRIGEGLEAQLENWCDQATSPRLIVVDTFQRVKPRPLRGANAYESDYAVLDGLQRLALKRSVAVVLVHHLRKNGYSSSDDPLERISGSMGLPGACDTILLLDGDRNSKDATLFTDGRDTERATLALRFENCVWSCLGSDAEVYNELRAYHDSPVIQGVLSIMRGQERWEGTARDLLDCLLDRMTGVPDSMSNEAVGVQLTQYAKRLLEEGITVERRRVKMGPKKTVRHIILTREAENTSFDL